MARIALTLNDLNDDVLYEICWSVGALTTDVGNTQGQVPLKNLSLVNKHFREITVSILFRNVCVVGPASESRMMIEGDWMTARAAIAALQNSLVKYIRNFKFDIYTSERPTEPPAEEDFKQLVKFLDRMPQLRKLLLYVPLPHLKALESAFEATEIMLPSVKILVFNPLCVFLMNKCPNLEVASVHMPDDWVYQRPFPDSVDTVQEFKVTLINALRSTKNLRRFEAKGPWHMNDLHALTTVAPKLQWLEMRGGWYVHEVDLLTSLAALSQFKNLERLDLADAYQLGLGFNPPRCGNAYMGPGGAGVRKQVEEDRKKTEEIAARAAFSSCTSLKEVWVGELSKARVIRGEGGHRDEIIWSRGKQETNRITK
ncbi:hypothetical protein AOQ84DRAFT_392860 [Glonium stellatum]|uniref:Uncharacterized protein n=1 Tax=Glonium stellatum TaxID=574774 RepID=A0A8E2JMW8_9PEZI|nr:hypothetical protein AOQ84DRAFT_392860 [Glonium stellatum]